MTVTPRTGRGGQHALATSSMMPPLCRRGLLVLVALAAAGRPAAAAPVPPANGDHRVVVLDALKQELARSRERLRLSGEDPPYFARYLLREYDDYDMAARFGAVLEDSYQN